MNTIRASIKLPVFGVQTGLSKTEIGNFEINRHSEAQGHVWTTRLAISKEWRSKPGVYEWRILDPSSPPTELACYLGVATKFADRVPMYWRDMASQLLDAYVKSKSITTQGSPRYEKTGLRWVHFWLAWAHVHSAPIELTLYEHPRRSIDAESSAIKDAKLSKRPLVNKEALGRGRVYVHDVRSLLNNHGLLASHVLPPDWTAPYDRCLNAAPWMAAIESWHFDWREAHNHRRSDA